MRTHWIGPGRANHRVWYPFLQSVGVEPNPEMHPGRFPFGSAERVEFSSNEIG